MPARRRSVEIEVLVDDAKARKNLDNLDRNVSKTGKTLSNFAKIAAGAFAFDKVVDFGRAAVDSFSNLNESTNAVNVTFGEAAEGILELGENAAESVGLANSEFNQLSVGFAAFADTIAGGTGQSVVGVVEELTTRIADFASVMNLDVPEAADKFRAGLAGETEPLRQFGIDVSAAAVNQKLLADGLVNSSSEISEQDKILGRYLLIMEQTDKAAGDFENTSDELANRQRILQAEFENAKASLGEGLVPAMVAALEVGNDLLPWVVRFADGLAEATGSIDFAELALRRVEQSLGLTRDSAQAFAEALVQIRDDSDQWWMNSEHNFRTFKQDVMDLADATNLGSQEIETLINFLPTMAERLGLSAEEAAFLEQILRQELTEATLRARGAAHSFERGWRQGGDAAAGAASNVASLTEEVLKNADPAFNLLKTNEAFVDAQKAYNDAVAEFGPESREARGAQANLVETMGRYNAARQVFLDNEPTTVEAWKALAREAGLYSDDLADILKFLQQIGQFSPGAPPALPGSTDPSATGPFHQGGTVPGTPGTDQLIMAQAGETVTRRAGVHTNGAQVINNISLQQMSDTQIRELMEIARRQ